MKIICADKKHKDQVLDLLDSFRTVCVSIISPGKKFISTSAKDKGGDIYDEIIDSKNSAIFLAEENREYIGIVTIHKVPRLRRGTFYGEIEEMFVEEEYQGIGIAQKLMEVAEKWARENKIEVIHLKSGVELKRAHAFYKKVGFKEYAKGYEKIL